MLFIENIQYFRQLINYLHFSHLSKIAHVADFQKFNIILQSNLINCLYFSAANPLSGLVHAAKTTESNHSATSYRSNSRPGIKIVIFVKLSHNFWFIAGSGRSAGTSHSGRSGGTSHSSFSEIYSNHVSLLEYTLLLRANYTLFIICYKLHWVFISRDSLQNL